MLRRVAIWLTTLYITQFVYILIAGAVNGSLSGGTLLLGLGGGGIWLPVLQGSVVAVAFGAFALVLLFGIVLLKEDLVHRLVLVVVATLAGVLAPIFWARSDEPFPPRPLSMALILLSGGGIGIAVAAYLFAARNVAPGERGDSSIRE